MSVDVQGLNRILNTLESEYGNKQMNHLSDAALKSAADIFLKELKSQFEPWADTRASINEMTMSEPYSESGARTIKIYWKGPNNRQNIIHINEFGTVKNPNPAGKGSIARALRISEKPYHNAIRRAVERGM